MSEKSELAIAFLQGMLKSIEEYKKEPLDVRGPAALILLELLVKYLISYEETR